MKDRSRFDVRYCITSSARSAAGLARNTRFHWGIENTPHWTLDATFQEDLSPVRKRHGAQNMAVVRKFAFNKAQRRAAIQRPAEPPRQTPPTANQAPLKLRRKIATWDVNRLAEVLMIQPVKSNQPGSGARASPPTDLTAAAGHSREAGNFTRALGHESAFVV